MKKRNRANNYDWKSLQKEYDSGFSIRRLAAKHGMATSSFTKAAKRGDFITRNGSTALKLYFENNAPVEWSVSAREKHSELMSHKMANRKVSSKRFIHNGITLESSWEKAVAISLDEYSIKWTRPDPILYNDGGIIRRYYPDFYLSDYDCYLDPKNPFVLKQDERKLRLVKEQNTINLIILNGSQLTWNIIQTLI